MPLTLDKSYNVGLDLKVPYIAQKRHQSCWYTCAKMIYLYRNPAKATIPGFFREALEKTAAGKAVRELKGKSNRLLDPETGNGATETDWPLLEQALGMNHVKVKDVEWFNAYRTKEEKDFTETQLRNIYLRLLGLLRYCGPIWAAGRLYQNDTNQGSGHVVVIRGVAWKDPGGSVKKPSYWVVMNDPAKTEGGGEGVVQKVSWFVRRLYHTGKSPQGQNDPTASEGYSPLMYLPAVPVAEEKKDD